MSKVAKAIKKNRTKKKTTKTSRFSYTKLAKLLKEGKSPEALRALLNYVEPEKQVKFVLNEINKSQFRAFNQGMKKLNGAISLYFKSNDINILTAYKSQNIDEVNVGSEASYKIFNEIKKLLIDTLIDPKQSKGNCFQIILLLGQYGQGASDFDYIDKYSTKLTANLAEQVWPDKAKGLKVLYGQV